MRNNILLIILLIFVGCNKEKESNNYTITGTITGIKDSVKIALLDFSKYQLVDSTYSLNEVFSFNRKFEEPFETTLYIYENGDNSRPKGFTFWVDNSDLDIIVDLDSLTNGKNLLNNYNIKNSRINDLYFKKEVIFQANWKEKMNALENAKTKEEKDSLNKAYYKKVKDNAINFAFKNSNSFLALAEINKYINKVSKDSLQLFYNTLSENLKSTQKAKFIEAFINSEKVSINNHFINFNAYNLEGKKITLSDFKGKVIVLDFWDRYCPPCRTMNREELSMLYETYKNKVTFISFSLDKAKENWILASKEDNIKWINISDLKGFDSKIAAAYKINLRPKTFIIDKNGIITNIFSGYGEGEIEPEIKKLIQ